RRPFLGLLPVLAMLGAVNYAFMMTMGLVPPEVHRHAPLALRIVYRLGNVAQVAFVAVGLHLVRDIPVRDDPPRPRWLLALYGSAAVVALLAVFPGVIPAPTFETSLAVFFVIRSGYVLLMIALMLRYAVPFVRRGSWRPGGLAKVRSADIVLLVGGLLGAAGWVIVSMTRSLTAPVPAWLLLYDMVVGLGLAAPLAGLVRVPPPRGAAVVPADETPPVAQGTIAIETIARAWPRAGPPVLPPGLAEYDLELPAALSEAFMAAEIAAVVPVASPRQP